jgi:hypothetical protein
VEVCGRKGREKDICCEIREDDVRVRSNEQVVENVGIFEKLHELAAIKSGNRD